METFSALLVEWTIMRLVILDAIALIMEFIVLDKGPVMRSFDAFFVASFNNMLNKRSSYQCFERHGVHVTSLSVL